MKPIRISIDVTKIDKALLFRGKKGVYLDLVAWPLRNPGDREETHLVKQSAPKDERDREMEILGNLTLPEEEQAPRAQTERADPKRSFPESEKETDDIPF